MKKPTFKSLSEDSRFIRLSEGNKKLVPNERTKFLIFNLPSVSTCPFANECKIWCYAKKAERAYPNCLKARERNFAISKEPDFVERMIFTIEAYLSKPSYQNAKKVVVRIHESGDFYDQMYANKWLQIAEHFKKNKKVVFMAYTKSLVFFCNSIYSEEPKPIPCNMTIRFSLANDTEYHYKRLADCWGFPTYSAVENFTNEPKHEQCRCSDCATCGKCWNKKVKSIVCEIH